MTDNEIIKVLECCISNTKDCSECVFLGTEIKENTTCEVKMIKNSLDFINRLQEENENLEYKLTGVMHFVDKWLDGAELKQDEVNRASAMREKTLQIVEKQQAEIDRLQARVDRLTLLQEAMDRKCPYP